MLSFLFARKSRDEGFTLIELLVVVIIIGLLAAIALPIFIDQTKAAVDASVKSDVRNTVTNVNNWRAQHDAALPASAEAYVAADGKLATSRGAYVGVAFTSDNDYTVCGYNPGGKNYVDYQHAWAFTASTGKFTNFADVSGECLGAVHARPAFAYSSDDGAGDGSGANGNGRVVTGTTSSGSSYYLAYDPKGKASTPAGSGTPTTPPSSGGGGTTTGDPVDPSPTSLTTLANIYPNGTGAPGNLGDYNGPRLGWQYNTSSPRNNPRWDVAPYYFGGEIYGQALPASGAYDSPDLNALDGLTPNVASSVQSIAGADYDVYYGTRNYSTGKVESLVKVEMNSKSACTFTYGSDATSPTAKIACPFDPNLTNGSPAATMFAADKAGNGGDIYGLVLKFKAKDINGAVRNNTLQLEPQTYDD